MDRINKEDLPALFERFKTVMAENRDFLIKLDGQVGDSDLGLTMNKAFDAAWQTVCDATDSSLGQTFVQAGMQIAKVAPSTMGTLIATGFMHGGKALDDAASMGTDQMLLFWRAFMSGIMKRGKAQPGDKTPIDILAPAVEALEIASQSDAALPVAMRDALAAAQMGLASTKKMVARHGKAACFVD